MAVRGSSINEKFRSTLPMLIQLKEIVEEKSSILTAPLLNDANEPTVVIGYNWTV